MSEASSQAISGSGPVNFSDGLPGWVVGVALAVIGLVVVVWLFNRK